MRGRRWATLAFVTLLAPGCGKRGDPRPPLRTTPGPVTEFRLGQRGETLELTAVAPRTSVDGVALERVAIEFQYVEGEGDLERAGRRLSVEVAPGERAVARLPLTAPGTQVRAAARAVAGRDAGARTLIRTIREREAVEAPRGLTAELGEEGVRLAWRGPRPEAVLPAASVVESPSAASGPARGGFLVYRRRPEGTYDAPLFAVPREERRYADAGVTPGEQACYAVSAAASVDPLVESAPSQEVCLEVRDVIPPAPPSGLTALARPGGVELAWSPSPEVDLALYRLYRASGEETPRLLVELPATTGVHLDASVEPGVTYRYALTAVDRAGNESRPGPGAQAIPR
jgi:hypothetical protein